MKQQEWKNFARDMLKEHLDVKVPACHVVLEESSEYKNVIDYVRFHDDRDGTVYVAGRVGAYIVETELTECQDSEDVIVDVISKRSELKKELDDIHYDFYNNNNNHYCDIDGYIEDIIYEFTDNKVDIYYSDLRKWLQDSEPVEYMDRAVDECYVDTKQYDFYKHVQAAQYLSYYDEFYNDEQLSIMLKCYVLDCLLYKDICTISEDVWDIIDSIEWCSFDTDDTVKTLIDEVKEYLSKGGVL